MNWRPACGPEVARRRARMMETARRYFKDQQVLEVSTPNLSGCAVSDPQIESVSARLRVAPDSRFYLRTSPEFCMKRLLAAGFGDIYEIGTVFRDGEVGHRHQPEFTMVEWYRLSYGLQEIIDDALAFIAAVLERSNYADNADRISYRQALLEHAKVDPTTADRETLARAAGADARLAATLGDKRDDWLNLILSQKVLPGFASDRLTVLYHYPASQAALARINPTDESVADRFEIFLGDLELANGYVELTDANEQRQRFESDQMERRKRGIEERPLDPRLIAALGSGLPDCSGVAVGFDRLQLIYENATDIASVRSFPFEGRVK